MILNVTNRKIVAENGFHAVSFLHRLRGMVGRKFDHTMDAMIFRNCNAIHTFFMGETLDVIFLDEENRIVKYSKAKPWRMCYRSRKAVSVVELPEGAWEKSRCAVGDILDLDAVICGEGAIRTFSFKNNEGNAEKESI